jgi:acetylornithine deacetylase/succinyl-diaminopimelate desuccinylase-like protein
MNSTSRGAQLKQELGLAWTESSGQPLALAITQTALNVRGLEAGHVESKAQNAIATEAKASLDFRLVPDQKPDRVHALVEQFIQQQAFTSCVRRLTWKPAVRTPASSS